MSSPKITRIFSLWSLALALILQVVLCLEGTEVLAADPSPPENPQKLLFIHASVGMIWLGPGSRLGETLGNNNYYVSDYDINTHPQEYGHQYHEWYNTFTDGFADLMNWNEVESYYTRAIPDPGGENDIIMIKPCFSTYLGMTGNPDDPPSGVNPRDARNNVGDIKQVMLDLLQDVFSQHPDKLFVLLTGPPLTLEDLGMIDARLPRPLAQWMMNELLVGYETGNVLVYDFFNLYTSNADGLGDPCGPNDVGLASGNHHRIWNNEVQHQVEYEQNYSAYCANHPQREGNLKATEEFVPVLNDFVNGYSAPSSGELASPRNLRVVN